jgi:hypothetical protein
MKDEAVNIHTPIEMGGHVFRFVPVRGAWKVQQYLNYDNFDGKVRDVAMVQGTRVRLLVSDAPRAALQHAVLASSVTHPSNARGE